MITNDQLIRNIQKKHNVFLEFEFLDSYGLYCLIHTKQGNSQRVNVYDSDCVVSGRQRTYMVREFLTNIIHQYLN